MKENIPLAKKLNIYAWIITAVVIILAFLMRPVKIEIGIDFSFLPPVHSSFNVIVAISLLFALYFIKNKNIKAHRNAIYVAMVFSVLFLLSYVVYHFTTDETKYCGSQRAIYFTFLLSHIILAAVSLPFILFTFIRGFTNQVERHKKLAKWVWPVWFYVAVSGPICYLMLRPCYS